MDGLKQVLGDFKEVFNQDADRLLSYNTKQQVNYLDRLLGFTNIMIMLCIMAYVVGYVFITAKGYLDHEAAMGVLIAQVSSTADVVGLSSGKMTTRYFSASEITYPGLERGNVFVATRVRVQQQKRGVCEDLTMPCHTADECSKDVGAECTPNRFCKEPSWCPVTKDEQQEIYKLPTDTLEIWIKSAIQFQMLADHKFFTTEMQKPIEHPAPDANTFTVRDLLLLCDPPVRFEEVSELGAAIEVQFKWDCQVELNVCKPKIQARRVDVLLDEHDIGFHFGWPTYTGDSDGTVTGPERELYEMYGIRFYFRTVGTGSKVSMTATILKLSTGASLLGFAPIIVDLMMLNLFKLSKKYRARKFMETEDLSDYFESVENKGEGAAEDDDNEVEQEQEEEEWRRRMEEEED